MPDLSKVSPEVRREIIKQATPLLMSPSTPPDKKAKLSALVTAVRGAEGWKPQTLPRAEEPSRWADMLTTGGIGKLSATIYQPENKLGNLWDSLWEGPINVEATIPEDVKERHPIVSGIAAGAGRVGSGMFSPGNIALMFGAEAGIAGLLKAFPKYAAQIRWWSKLGFTTKQIVDAIKSGINLSEAKSPYDKAKAASGLASDVGFGVGGIIDLAGEVNLRNRESRLKNEAAKTASPWDTPKPSPNEQRIPIWDLPHEAVESARVTGDKSTKSQQLPPGAPDLSQPNRTREVMETPDDKLAQRVEATRKRIETIGKPHPERRLTGAAATSRNTRLMNTIEENTKRLNRINKALADPLLSEEVKSSLRDEATAIRKRLIMMQKSGGFLRIEAPKPIQWSWWTQVASNALTDRAANETFRKSRDAVGTVMDNSNVRGHQIDSTVLNLQDVPENLRTVKGLRESNLPQLESARNMMKWATTLLRKAGGGRLHPEYAGGVLDELWELPAKGTPERAKVLKLLADDPTRGDWLGLKPKFKSISELTEKWSKFAVLDNARAEVVAMLKELGVIKPLNGETPDNWKLWRHYLLATAIYGTEKSTHEVVAQEVHGKPNTKESKTEWLRVAVHPMAYPAVYTMLPSEKPSYFGTGEGLYSIFDPIRAWMKYMKLTFSLFHPTALSWQGMWLNSGESVRRGAQAGWEMAKGNPGLAGENMKLSGKALYDSLQSIFFLNPHMWRGTMEAVGEIGGRRADPRTRPAFQDREIYEDRLKHGGNPSAHDASEDIVFLMEKWGRFPRALAGWNHAIFEHYMTGMMNTAYQNIIAGKQLNNPNMTPEELASFKRATNETVNNAFGAISFKRLLLSRDFQNGLNLLMLAPAWGFSNLKIATQALGGKGRPELAASYFLGHAVAWYIGSQLLNYAITKHYNMPDKDGNKGGHLTFSNPGAPLHTGIPGQEYPSGLTDHSFDVSMGYAYDDKGNPTQQIFMPYPRGMQEFFIEAGGTLKQKTELALGKAGGLPRLTYDTIQAGLGKKQWGEVALDAFVPIPMTRSIQEKLSKAYPGKVSKPGASNSYYGIPTSHGLTQEAAVQQLSQAIQDLRKSTDSKDNKGISSATERIKTLAGAAGANHLNWKLISSLALRDANSFQRRKLKALATP